MLGGYQILRGQLVPHIYSSLLRSTTVVQVESVINSPHQTQLQYQIQFVFIYHNQVSYDIQVYYLSLSQCFQTSHKGLSHYVMSQLMTMQRLCFHYLIDMIQVC